MNIPKELTTVTHISKTLALTLFISLPILAFSFGMKYQKGLDDQKSLPFSGITPTFKPSVECAEDTHTCPDGSTVGRILPNCEFDKCVDSTKKSVCGKVWGTMCPAGYYCKYKEGNTDEGICVEDVKNIEGRNCGVVNGKKCPSGYSCIDDDEDGDGECMASGVLDVEYTCPKDSSIDCMPGPGKRSSQCAPAYIKWAKENCPGFGGVVY